MGDDTETVEGCSVQAETTKAILVRLPTGGDVWVPKSQIHDDSEVWKTGQTGDLVVSRWYAERNGIG